MSLSSAEQRTAGPASEDADLVALARQGREAAVRLLIQRYNQQLFRTARGVVRDDAEAEDVVQEAYFLAFTKLDGFRGEASFSTWITRIALNLAYGRLRRRRPFVELSQVEAEGGTDGAQIVMFPTTPVATDPEKETGREQVRRFLEQAVDQIPEPFRMVFILRDIQGMSVEEAAALLSLNPKTVNTRLFRARKCIRLKLEKALSPQFTEIFPFDGARCAHMADQVIGRLQRNDLYR
ncbi:MAG TPA: RNA polymerase sigma factor [Devosiaceae bacterium]|jgi:RNA polymerase sigma-70 factor (ECF subfamily)|nr:RNA polymerase sigma factor [Devosiaceae bacterium]